MKLNEEQIRLITQAIGSASMCWKPRPGKQVFDSEEAIRVEKRLVKKLEKSLKCDVCESIKNRSW